MQQCNTDAVDLSAALRTTGSVRQFTAEPVADSLLFELLDDARFAPSGGNRQAWRVVVVKDAAIRRTLAELMQPVWNEYVAMSATGRTPFAAVDPGTYEVISRQPGTAPNALLDHITEVPVVLVVAADLAQVAMMDKDLERPAITGGGSIYPFCWNLLLAARSRGLGGVMTTFLARAEPQAAPILGLPNEYVIAAMLFIGHPVHQPTRLRRFPVDAFTTIDRFDGEVFSG